MVVIFSFSFFFRIAKSKKAVEKLKSRILVITNGGESAAQYMTFMNVFFTCQKNVSLLWLNVGGVGTRRNIPIY